MAASPQRSWQKPKPWENKFKQELDGDVPLVTKIMSGHYPFEKQPKWKRPKPKMSNRQEIIPADPDHTPMVQGLVQGQFYTEPGVPPPNPFKPGRSQEKDPRPGANCPLVRSLLSGAFLAEAEVSYKQKPRKKDFVLQNRVITKFYTDVAKTMLDDPRMRGGVGRTSRLSNGSGSMGTTRSASVDPNRMMRRRDSDTSSVGYATPRNIAELQRMANGMIEPEAASDVLNWLRNSASQWEKDNFKRVVATVAGASPPRKGRRSASAMDNAPGPSVSRSSTRQSGTGGLRTRMAPSPTSFAAADGADHDQAGAEAGSRAPPRDPLEGALQANQTLNRLRQAFRNQDRQHSGVLPQDRVLDVLASSEELRHWPQLQRCSMDDLLRGAVPHGPRGIGGAAVSAAPSVDISYQVVLQNIRHRIYPGATGVRRSPEAPG